MPRHSIAVQAILAPPLDGVAIVLYALVFAAVAWLTRLRPSYGVAALIALAPFAFYRTLGPTTVTFPKIALLAAVAGLALRRCDPGVLRAPAARAFVLCAVGVLAATALSLAHAASRGPALRETLKSTEYLLLFCTVVVAARADRAEAPARLAFAGSVIAVSVLAIAQEVVGAPSGLWFMNHVIPRVAGPLEGPNQLAGYLGIALCVVAAYLLARRAGRLEAVALALGAAALVLTISRAGVPLTLGSLALVAVVSPARAWRTGFAVLAGGTVAGLAILGLWGYAATHSLAGLDFLGRFSSLAEAADPGSVGTRTQLWHAASILWRQHPFFGIGAGNFEFELGRAGFPGLRTHANSLYLQALVEGGVPLLLATVALVLTSISRFARGPFSEPLVAGALGASAGLALHQVFDFLVFFPKVGDLWWIVLALGAARLDGRARA